MHEPGGWGAETARPASASTAPSRGRITAIPPRSSPSAFCDAALQPEPDRRVDRLPAPAVDARDHAVAEPQCRTRRPAEPVVVDALEPGRLVARGARDRGAGRIRVQQPPAGVVDVRRAAAGAPLRRRTSSPSSRPGSRSAGVHATRPSPCSSSRGLERHRAFERPEVLRRDLDRDAHGAAAEQRARAADRDLLGARGAVRAPVVGEERDPRVRLPAAAVQQRVHRLVVALASTRSTNACTAGAPLVVVELLAHQRVRARGERGEDHDGHEQQRSATARAGAAGARAWAGRGTANRPGARTRAIRTGNGVDVGGPPLLVLAGRADRLPSIR